jgi:transcriptional regulator with XRE-family HTH domain
MDKGTNMEEGTSGRWKRLYDAPGGPLVGWLLDEAAKKGMTLADLGAELRVTTGYLAQLRAGIRESANISHDFAAACAVFLQVPAVVVLIVAGSLRLVDFVCATDFDRWVESTVGHEGAQPVHLACGAQLGIEELRLLPRIVEALHAAASVHETRARLV